MGTETAGQSNGWGKGGNVGMRQGGGRNELGGSHKIEKSRPNFGWPWEEVRSR